MLITRPRAKKFRLNMLNMLPLALTTRSSTCLCYLLYRTIVSGPNNFCGTFSHDFHFIYATFSYEIMRFILLIFNAKSIIYWKTVSIKLLPIHLCKRSSRRTDAYWLSIRTTTKNEKERKKLLPIIILLDNILKKNK